MGSLKTTNHELPRDLSLALSAAQTVLLRAERLAEALRATGTAIPALLAEERRLSGELGALEIEGGDISELRARLDAVAAERAAAGRQRSSAAEGLRHMDGQLAEARQILSRARGLYGTGIMREFAQRWQAKCNELAALRAEAEGLSKALGVSVPCPAPYAPQLNRITDAPELRALAASGPVTTPPLPEALAVVAGIADRLDSANALCTGVRQSAELTAHYFATARERGLKSELGGVFTVIKPFDALGTHFEPGMLLDRGVLSEGSLERYWKGRCLQPVAEGAMIAAA
jgi:hypothetical protein